MLHDDGRSSKASGSPTTAWQPGRICPATAPASTCGSGTPLTLPATQPGRDLFVRVDGGYVKVEVPDQRRPRRLPARTQIVTVCYGSVGLLDLEVPLRPRVAALSLTA